MGKWLDQRVRKVDKKAGEPATTVNNPAIDLMQKLTGTSVPGTKLRCGWQLWSKDHFVNYKEAFEKEFQKTGLCPKDDKAHHRVAFIQRMYAELPEEERGEWEERAADEKAKKPGKKERKKAKKTALLDPAAAQA